MFLQAILVAAFAFGGDDRPGKKPDAEAADSTKAKPTKKGAAKPAERKTGPKDWPRNFNGVPQPPDDWFAVLTIDGDTPETTTATILFKGETEKRTIKANERLEKGVIVDAIKPRFGFVSIRYSGDNYARYYIPSKQPKAPAPDADVEESERRSAEEKRRSDEIRRADRDRAMKQVERRRQINGDR